jgi:hypothetical protein
VVLPIPWWSFEPGGGIVLYFDIILSNAPRSQSRQERILDGADKGNPVIQM